PLSQPERSSGLNFFRRPLAPGPWPLAPGPWHLALGTWHLLVIPRVYHHVIDRRPEETSRYLDRSWSQAGRCPIPSRDGVWITGDIYGGALPDRRLEGDAEGPGVRRGREKPAGCRRKCSAAAGRSGWRGGGRRHAIPGR